MTEDRRNLLTAMWRSCWPACRCGRCPCTARAPEATARAVLAHWARQSSTLAESMARRAEAYRAIAKKSRATQKRIARKYGQPTEKRDTESIALIERTAAESDRRARQQTHASQLYERLSRGEDPFRPRTPHDPPGRSGETE